MDFPVARNLQIDKNFWGEPYDSDQLKTNNWSGGKKKQVTSMSWHLSPRYGWVPCGVDGHTDGYVIAKISWIDRGYQILLGMGGV